MHAQEPILVLAALRCLLPWPGYQRATASSSRLGQLLLCPRRPRLAPSSSATLCPALLVGARVDVSWRVGLVGLAGYPAKALPVSCIPDSQAAQCECKDPLHALLHPGGG
jgi:hypothetical protein